MKKTSLFLIAAAMLLCACNQTLKDGSYDVIPLPNSVETVEGDAFVLTAKTKIYYPTGNEDLRRNAGFLVEYVNDMIGVRLEISEMQGQVNEGICLLTVPGYFAEPESYEMKVSPKQIVIAGEDPAGVFYGIQTLRKSLPIVKSGEMVDGVSLPCANISDAPRFHYRGMHLDPCRHFITMDSMKIYVDMLALHNMNTFHLHLTEDQGWRMEIKKYPELCKIGAYRSGTVIGHNSGVYDSIPHGGYYTQEELRDLVRYAANRYITIIPEIDLPGHMLAALTAYPELGCTGGPYEVWRQWGVSEDVLCAGNEDAMLFLEDVLAEVMDVFPSEMIHIGGDECPKTRWEKCPKCQAKIKELGIKVGKDDEFTAEDYLQSYVMTRMEKFIEDHGRRIIGWDEILAGEVADNAIIMSWRGVEGGITAAKSGHDAVMTPNGYLYFDYYQSDDTEHEPDAIGGYVPVEKVYSYEPVAEELTAEERKHILGVQANVWTEYIPSFRQVQYMCLPRMAALCEVQWCQPEQKDYDSFIRRCMHMIDVYEHYGYHYAKHILDLNVKMETDLEQGCINVTLTKCGGGEIRYTLDGSDPLEGIVYTEPFSVCESCDFRAVAMLPQGPGREYQKRIEFCKSTAKPVTLTTAPYWNYTYKGAPMLTDALKGNGNYGCGRWLGFWNGNPCEAIIDLKGSEEISRVRFDALERKGDWIYNPSKAEVFVSNDGSHFDPVAMMEYPVDSWEVSDGIKTYELEFAPVSALYVMVRIEPHDLPEDHGAYGNPAWLFVDEIEVF